MEHSNEDNMLENGNNNRNAGILTADQVASLIQAGLYTIVAQNGSSRKKSVVWLTFNAIKDTAGETIDFVSCSDCKEVLKYNNKAQTTSHLMNHAKNKCSAITITVNNNEVRSPRAKCMRRLSFSSSPQNTAPVSSQEQDLSILHNHQKNRLKNEVTHSIATLCAKDIRPFNIASSDQFRQLAQKFIDIGHKYGQIPAEDIIPSDRTISAHIDQIYKEILQQGVLPGIKEPISSGKIPSFNIFA